MCVFPLYKLFSEGRCIFTFWKDCSLLGGAVTAKRGLVVGAARWGFGWQRDAAVSAEPRWRHSMPFKRLMRSSWLGARGQSAQSPNPAPVPHLENAPGKCSCFSSVTPPPRKKWCLGTNLHLGGFIKGVLRKKMESFPAKSICCSFLKQEPSSSEDSGSLEPFNIKGLSSRLE